MDCRATSWLAVSESFSASISIETARASARGGPCDFAAKSCLTVNPQSADATNGLPRHFVTRSCGFIRIVDAVNGPPRRYPISESFSAAISGLCRLNRKTPLRLAAKGSLTAANRAVYFATTLPFSNLTGVLTIFAFLRIFVMASSTVFAACACINSFSTSSYLGGSAKRRGPALIT